MKTEMNLFVYGTLMSPEIMNSVIGRVPLSEPGIARGYARRAFKDEIYPAMIKHKDELVNGLIYFELTTEDFTRLDYFEGEMYERLSILVSPSNRQFPCYTYLLKVAYQPLLTEEHWDFDRFMAMHSNDFNRDFRGWDDLGDC